MGLICVLLQLYIFDNFIRLIMCWFPPTPGTTYQQIYDGFVTVTEPVLAPVRAIMPPMRMGAMALDLSPIVVLLGLQLIYRLICG